MNALALTYADGTTSRPASRNERYAAYASAQTREIGTPLVESWDRDVRARLIHLMSLSKGWDGSDSPPVRPEVATFAWAALSSMMRPTTAIPFIAPVAGGGLQIEWHIRGLDIELYISQPSRAELYIEYQDGRDRVEQDLNSDFEALNSAIAEIS